jgi:hypothetical protein
MSITVKLEGIDKITATLSDLDKRQIPFAMKTGINKTAEMVKTYEAKGVKTHIDRPTQHTLRTLVIGYAEKAKSGEKTTASVGFTDDYNNKFGGTPGARFMYPQVEGGQRNLKRFEHALRYKGILPNNMYVVPGAGCTLDAYGNIPNSLINQIISYFGAVYKSGYNAETTMKKKKRLAKGSKSTGFGYEYFVSHGKGAGSTLPPGIYKRTRFAMGSAIKPVMMFVKAPAYAKRFAFYEIGRDAFNKFWRKYFDEALSAALKTAK